MIVSKSSILLMTAEYQLVQRIPFTEIALFGLSTFADGWMVINLTPIDGKKGLEERPSLLIHSKQKAEIITVLVDEYSSTIGRELPLKFSDDFQVIVMYKKPGFMTKRKATANSLTFSEDGNLNRSKYIAKLKPQRTKKEPGYDKTVHPFINEIVVSSALGVDANLQMNDPIPERVLNHTKAKHKGKKRARNVRRRY